MDKNIKGVSILESLVCIVIIGIGFIAMLQLSSYSINAMDRSLETSGEFNCIPFIFTTQRAYHGQTMVTKRLKH